MSIESTHTRSWVSDRANFGYGFGMTYPHQDGCGGVAGGTSPASCPTPVAPFARVCASSRTSRGSRLLLAAAEESSKERIHRNCKNLFIGMEQHLTLNTGYKTCSLTWNKTSPPVLQYFSFMVVRGTRIPGGHRSTSD